MSTLFKTKEKKFIVLSIALIVIQMIICIIVGYNKRNLFCDEVFTYGLSNCEDYAFLNKETFDSLGHNGWVDADFLQHYVDVDEETPWSFKAAYNNQVADVHPPLYYFLMHFMCILFGGSFTKWSGLVLNLIILLGIDLALFYVGRTVFNNDKLKAILSIVLWSCSAVGLSNIVFIRMYLLLTLECILFVVVHIGILKRLMDNENGKVFTVKRLVYLALVVITGGLTHYYFYPFVFFFGASVSVLLLARKKIKSILIYIGTMLAAFGINLLIFPETIHHVFDRARGTEVLSNLTGRTGDIYPQYIKMINRSMFGGLLLPLFIICVLGGTVLFTRKRRLDGGEQRERTEEKKKEKGLIPLILNASIENLVFSLICIATYGFLIIAIQGSQLIANRYIWQAYPFLAIIAVKLIMMVLSGFIKQKYIAYTIAVICCVLLCVLSIFSYGIEYMYVDYDEEVVKTADLKGCDCIAYNRYDWIDDYTTFFISLDYDETYLIKPNELDSVSDILKGRRTESKLVLWVPTLVDEKETTEFLNKVMNQVDYSEYIFRGDYLRMQVFELK